MKKRACFCAAIFFAFTVAVFAYCPIIDGALADINLHVFDDMGGDVSNADVAVEFYTAPEKVDVKRGKTDAQGSFSVKGKCVGEVYVTVRKDGYYDTRISPGIVGLGEDMVAKMHRWSEKPIDVKLTLKKVRCPRPLVRRGGKYSGIKYPVLDGEKGFDLLKFDWCAPYGTGEYADIQIRTEFWRAKDDWLKVYEKTVVTMANSLDGFYLADIDGFSAFRYAYSADPAGQYDKELLFEYDRRTGTLTKSVGLPKGKYIVFRTRTKVDEHGKIVSANYGVITEDFDPSMTLDISVVFNPNVNDPVLEGNWKHVLPPVGN